MKNIKQLFLVMLFLSCKGHKKDYSLSTGICSQFKQFEEYIYDEGGKLYEYKFYSPLDSSLLTWIRYPKDTLVGSVKGKNELVFARELFNNGDIYFYLVSPPKFRMETITEYLDTDNNIIGYDTIEGSKVKFNINNVSKINISVTAYDMVTNIYIPEDFSYTSDSIYDTGLIFKSIVSLGNGANGTPADGSL